MLEKINESISSVTSSQDHIVLILIVVAVVAVGYFVKKSGILQKIKLKDK